MWLLEQLASPHYNNSLTVKILGAVDCTILENCLQEIIQRHEVLRTCYGFQEEQLQQFIIPEVTFCLPLIELENSEYSDLHTSIRQQLLQETQRPFNLSQDIPLRGIILKISDQEHWLHLTWHHIASDDTSYTILLKELTNLYAAFAQGLPSSLPTLPIQYADFAHWQRQHLTETKLANSLVYWQKQLADCPPNLTLPYTFQQPTESQNLTHTIIPFELSQDLTASIKALSQQQQVTRFTTLLAAFYVLLYRYSGQNDIVIGTPVSLRDRPETQDLIGVFTNNLVLRSYISDDLSFIKLLKQVKNTIIEAQDHQQLPYLKLVETLKPERIAQKTELFQVLFDFQSVSLETLQVLDLSFSPVQLHLQTSSLNLILHIEEVSTGLVGYFMHPSSLLGSSRSQHMVQDFQVLLEEMITEATQPISKLSLFTAAKQEQLSCYLIGHESLLIPCANSLLKCGYKILGIISTGTSITQWTTAQEIPCISPTEDLIHVLSQQPFDYLFSIHNLLILPQKIIDLPRRGAINCHNALLPKYGGLNAPSWAIIHQEKTHGITWHQITNLIDGGDIFKQVPIPIAQDETASTLLSKCYEVVIQSFAQLIDEIACDQVILTSQNLDNRSYFSREKKPSPGCILSWNQSADKIEALVRALDFGHYDNILGLPKLAIGNEFIIISQIKVLENPSSLPPGTIISIHEDGIVIATASYDILLNQVLTIEGQVLSISEFVKRFKLKVGNQFNDISFEQKQQIYQLEKEFLKHEKYWVKRLSSLNLASIPYIQKINSSFSSEPEYKSEELLILTEVKKFLEKYPKAWSFNEFITVALIAYIARISQSSSFDIGLKLIDIKEKVAKLEGLFSSLLPGRIDVNTNQNFEGIFQAISQQLNSVKRHKSYARDIVMRYPKIKKLRNSNWKSLANTVIIETVQNLDNESINLEGSLILRLSEAEEKCTWLYNTEIFDTDSIVRMQKQFTTFINSIINNPALNVSKLNLLSEKERNQILVNWNNTQTDYLKDLCIHQLFEQQVKQNPDAIAVGFKDQQLTYRELNEKANQLAHYLQKLGLKSETLVGICIERSLEMIVGLLGILKAGGAYVPLDTNYPIERLNYIVSDAKISFLLTQYKYANKFSNQKLQKVDLDQNWDKIEQESQENIVSLLTPKNLAYIIYTSGSTGNPKGVMITHQSLLNFTQAAVSKYKLSPSERVLQFASISFDAVVEEIYPILSSGGTLVLRNDEFLDSISTFLQKCEDYQITTLSLPTAYWHQLTAELATTDYSIPNCLRLVIIGGEKVMSTSVKLWKKYVGNYPKLVNTYGPTEATVVTTTYSLTASTQIDQEVPIGRAIANVTTYILDSNLQPVPIGIPGELYVGGDGLARGYLNRPELTQEKFIPNPFGVGRLYKTGDLARYLPDGNIEFIGRIDNQVKIRGFRIELGEIETVLTQYQELKEAVVIVREDQPGEKQLVAYIVAKSNSVPTSKQLRHFLKQQLPDYMIPAAFVPLEALPITVNGKIDRYQLSALELQIIPDEDTFVAPRDELEQKLVEIWEKILGKKPIGIIDNFFELGGHSLLAVKLFNQIEKHLDKKLPLSQLFQSPTIQELAVLLKDSGWQPSSSSLISIKSAGSHPPLFGVHGMGGEVLVFNSLSQYLDANQPLYGLRARGLDGQQSPHNCLEQMAADYLQEIFQVQPVGPYFLSGFSSGGRVAFEMARQLREQGHSVALLALFDCGLPDDWILQKVSHKPNNSQPNTTETVKIANKFALNQYIPKPYPGHAILFQCESKLWENQSSFSVLEHQGQQYLLSEFIQGGCIVEAIPGQHGTILKEPHVQVLSKKFNRVLEQARQNLAQPNLEIIKLYQKAIDTNANIPFWVERNLAEILTKQGNLDAALTHYQKAVELQPSWFYQKLAKALSNSESLEDGLSAFETAINWENYKSDHFTELWRDIQNQISQKQGTIETYQKALELQPLWLYEKIKPILRIQKQTEAVVMVYQKAIEYQPQNPKIYQKLGDYQLSQAQTKQAILSYQKSLEIEPNAAMVYCSLGNAYLKVKEMDLAKSSYRKAIKLNPKSVTAYRKQGLYYQENKQFEQAISSYQQIIKLQPEAQDIYSNIGQCHLRLKQLEKGKAYFHQALELARRPEQKAKANQGLGDCFQQQGNIKQAMVHYQKAMQLQSDFIPAHLQMGHIKKQQGQFEEAIAYYQKVLEINPHHFGAYKNLGESFKNLGNIEAAITAYQKALKIQPNNQAVIRHLNTLQKKLTQTSH